MQQYPQKVRIFNKYIINHTTTDIIIININVPEKSPKPHEIKTKAA